MEEEKKVNFYVVLTYFITLVLFVGMRICSSCGLFSFMGNYASYYLGLILQIGLVFLLPFILFKIFTKSKIKDVFKFCSFRKISLKLVLVSVGLGIVVYCLNCYVSGFFNTIIQFFGYNHVASASSGPQPWWILVLNLICTAVLPAIAEEFLHRGLLLNGTSMLGVKKSIIISGVLFGLFHLNIEQCFYAIVIGIFLGFLCYTSYSIYPCIIVHFMNNAISVFMSFARSNNWAIGYAYKLFTNTSFIGIMLSILFFWLLLVLIKQLMTYIMKDTFEYNFGKKHKQLAEQVIRESYFQQIDDIKNNNDIKSATFNGMIIETTDLFNFIERNRDKIEFGKMPKSVDMDTKTKILMWGCFALSTIITIMTFIWGLLR